jgi:phage-related holin
MIEDVAGMFREFCAWAWLKTIIAGLVSFVLEMVGYPESAIVWLIYLITADWILGLGRAWKTGNPNRRKFYKGMGKILFYAFSVILVGFVDRAIGVAFKVESMPYEWQDFVILYLCIGEFLSCAGHLAFFGVRFPDAFLRRLEQYRAHIEVGPMEKRSEREGKYEDAERADVP